MADFNAAFTLLVGNEGGYVNNPKDPGGATRWGVTQRVARASGYTGDMKEYPLEAARQVAKKLYWDPLHLDDVDDRIAFQLLDANFNGGHVVLWAQQALGMRATGKQSQELWDALKSAHPYIFQMKFIAARLDYFTMCKPWPTFGRGWARRVAGNLRQGAK